MSSQESKPSITATFTPLVSALLKAEDTLGLRGEWEISPVVVDQPVQRHLLDKFYSARGDLQRVLQDGIITRHGMKIADPLKIESIGSSSAAEINKFLEEQALAIRLREFGPLEFGIASLMELGLIWASGEGTNLKAKNGVDYDGALVKKARVWQPEDPSYRPVATIRAEIFPYTFNATVPNREIGRELDLLTFVDDVRGQKRSSSESKYRGVIYPKVSMDQQPDISWLRGLRKDLFKLVEAYQQTQFDLDENGLFIKSGMAAIGVLSGYPELRPLVIDEPFVCWVQRQDISFPLFTGYLNYPDWKSA